MNILLILGIAAAVIVLLLILVVAFSVRVSNNDLKEKQRNGKSLKEEDAKILQGGRERLMALRKMTMQIKEQSLRERGNEVCTLVDKILQTLKEKPTKIKNARQFLNYYLPTLEEVFSKYRQMEESKVSTEQMTAKLKNYLIDVKTALMKLYENLFAEDVFDMAVDMEAMTIAAKREGLLEDKGSEEKIIIEEEKEKIKLTI